MGKRVSVYFFSIHSVCASAWACFLAYVTCRYWQKHRNLQEVLEKKNQRSLILIASSWPVRAGRFWHIWPAGRGPTGGFPGRAGNTGGSKGKRQETEICQRKWRRQKKSGRRRKKLVALEKRRKWSWRGREKTVREKGSDSGGEEYVFLAGCVSGRKSNGTGGKRKEEGSLGRRFLLKAQKWAFVCVPCWLNIKFGRTGQIGN